MIISKPAWLTHIGKKTNKVHEPIYLSDDKNRTLAIYCIDVHPSHLTLASGATDGSIKIWNIENIFYLKGNEEEENLNFKCLASMNRHNGKLHRYVVNVLLF